MTLGIEAMRARAQVAAALVMADDFEPADVCFSTVPALAADVLALVAELERVTAERDALEYALAEGAEFVRKGGLEL